MKIKGSHGGDPLTHLKNLLFLCSVAECSITLQQNGKKERSNSADRDLGIDKKAIIVIIS